MTQPYWTTCSTLLLLFLSQGERSGRAHLLIDLSITTETMSKNRKPLSPSLCQQHVMRVFSNKQKNELIGQWIDYLQQYPGFDPRHLNWTQRGFYEQALGELFSS